MTLEPATASLTVRQQAALARIAYALESPGAVALLCGPAGVGKTLVLSQIAGIRPLRDRWCEQRTVEDATSTSPGNMPGGDGILLIDDAHDAQSHDLAAVFEAWRRRQPRGGLVLAGEGRLLTLVARHARIEQSVVLRSTLGPFSPAETRSAVASRLMSVKSEAQVDALARTIHEIAAGIPARVVRLADLVEVVAATAPEGGVTADDVENLHRRLVPQAA